jgi:hypothetical protein
LTGQSREFPAFIDREVKMDQKTHAWIALRALKLIEDEGQMKGLVKLLKPQARGAAIGAWLPDDRDAKKGSAATSNHVFKMTPYLKKQNRERFITKKADLLKKLGDDRAIHGFLKDDKTLDAKWWARPYRADVEPRRHSPCRGR